MKKIISSVFIFILALTLSSKLYAEEESATSSSYNSPTVYLEGSPPPPIVEKPTAGYDGGFFIQSKDGDFRLSFGARADTMFYWESENLVDNPATFANEGADTLTFRLRRSQIWMAPSYKKLSAFVLIGYSAPGGSVYWYGNASYSFLPNVSVTWGMVDPEFGITSIFSSSKFSMVDYPLVLTQKDGEQVVWSELEQGATIARPSTGLPTQLGFLVSGDHFDNHFHWMIGVGNGSEGLDELNVDREFQYSIRLQYSVFDESPYDGDMTDYSYRETPALGFGLGGAFEHDDATHTPTGGNESVAYEWSLDGAADIIFRYRGLAINLGGYYRQIKVGPGATVEAGEKYLTDIAYLATASYYVLPKRLEIQTFGSQILREGPDNNVYEFGGGVNYYFKGHNAQFQVDYSRVIDFDDIAGTDNRARNRIRARMQMKF